MLPAFQMRVLKYQLLFIMFLTTPTIAKTTAPPTPPPGLPVDGGVLALLVAGLFYGVKKSFKKK